MFRSWQAPFLPLLPYLKNLAGVPGEFLEMVRGFQQAQQKRWEERQILDLASLGLVSGFWEGMESRARTMLESPSVYNVANWLSMGLLDPGKGAIHPEKPLSLEHWLDSLVFASALFGMYETGKRAEALRKSIPGEYVNSKQGSLAVDTVHKNTEERSRLGNQVPPTEKTLDMALNPEAYANEIVKKYGINLQGSGKNITIKYNPDLRRGIYGITLGSNPSVIEIGSDALISEVELAKLLPMN